MSPGWLDGQEGRNASQSWGMVKEPLYISILLLRTNKLLRPGYPRVKHI